MGWENHFLDTLSAADMKLVRPHTAPVNLTRSTILDRPGAPIVHVYFPVDCILSVITVMRDGGQVESRTIGRESGYGLLHVLGSPIAFEKMEVQVSGRAWRAPLAALRDAAFTSSSLVQAIVHHAQATILQASQSAACNRLHATDQRLCRWLLMTQDRLGGTEVVPLTQEHLSIMLGVQRTTVTAVASQLQERGAISYVRGKIRVLDRTAIEAQACECYEAIQRGVAAMLGPPP